MDSYNRKTDEELLRRMHNGDKKVIDYLMVKYKNLVRKKAKALFLICLLYTSPNPRDRTRSRMPSSA